MLVKTSLIVAAAVLYAIFMPKKVALWEILIASIFVYAMDLFIIQIFEIKYNLFVYTGEGVQWAGVIIEAIIYPAVNSIYINYYPYTKNLKKKALYIIIASIAFTFGEYVFLKIEFLKYNNWKLIYSALIYPFLGIVLIQNQILFRKLVYKKNT